MMICKTKISAFTAMLFGVLLSGSALYAHCQIPCGIYNDKMRIVQLREHVTTIEKSMNMIMELSKTGDTNYNQLVRWVMNKEDHATQIQELVTQYFLAQRIKPVEMADPAAYAAYTQQTVMMQQIIFYAMKAKQTTDHANCEKLGSLINGFVKVYFSEEDQKHKMEHHE